MIGKHKFLKCQILIIADFTNILYIDPSIREESGERCNHQIDRRDREESTANELSSVVSVSDDWPLYRNRHGFSGSGLSLAYTTM